MPNTSYRAFYKYVDNVSSHHWEPDISRQRRVAASTAPATVDRKATNTNRN